MSPPLTTDFLFSKKPRCRAFTLSELLVTIAILGILIALVFPHLQKLGDRRRSTKCLSNIRQLGQGIMLFVADHNGKLPPSEEGSSPEASPWPGPSFGEIVPKAAPTWAEYICRTYFDNDIRVFACPSLPVSRSYQVRGNRPDYGFNQRLSPINPATGFREGLRLVNIERPSQIILLGESGFPSGQNYQTGYFRLRDALDLYPNHLNSVVNVLYLDLHSEAHPLDFAHPPANEAPLGRFQFVP